MSSLKTHQDTFENWFASLPKVKQNEGPARGTIGAALVILEQLKTKCELSLDAHRTREGQSQLRGVTPKRVRDILASFGETRPFVGEGARTNRGAAGAIGDLLSAFEKSEFANLAGTDRVIVVEQCQRFLVSQVEIYHSRQRIELLFDRSLSLEASISAWLKTAGKTGKAASFAQHLVGAKLEIRFPDLVIENRPVSAADVQVKRPGDFAIGDSAFHVTLSPSDDVFRKCNHNLDHGFRPWLLVPADVVAGARSLADNACRDRISVRALESFIAQNIEELGGFQTQDVTETALELLQAYNKRVDEVETDKSLLVVIPRNI